jgi:hypothetical protein
MMTQAEMLQIIRAQLAIDLNCAALDLARERDSVVFVEARENPGRRPFARGEEYFEIVSMGKSIVVSATPERMAIAKAQMAGKDRDTIFAMPFIRGLYLHYVPDLKRLTPSPVPDGFMVEQVECDDIPHLLTNKEFKNALIYNADHPYQTVMAMVGRKSGRVAGIAGACNVCARLRQIGVDVLPEYQNSGLATYLVNRITYRILEQGNVPVYDTIASNIASQRVAHSAGYYPFWVSDWRCDFRPQH